MSALHRVVIVGGGFGGLYAAKALGQTPVAVTLIDRRNFHLFQPLLYQVATGGLSPGEIASPLRVVLRAHQNTEVLLGEVVDLDAPRPPCDSARRRGGVRRLDRRHWRHHHYFGKRPVGAARARLKTVEDATEIPQPRAGRLRARRAGTDLDKRRAWLTFVIVGGGPTGCRARRRLGRKSPTHPASRFPPHQSRRRRNPADRGRGPRAAAIPSGPFGQARNN